MLEASTKSFRPKDPTSVLEQMPSIDVEELLDTDLLGYVKENLKVVRDIIWNRRTFRSRIVDGEDGDLVGLVPVSIVPSSNIAVQLPFRQTLHLPSRRSVTRCVFYTVAASQ